jgi:hypothetical protein
MSDLKRTQFAMQALSLAETFNLLMEAERVKGPITYRVELSAPDGPSTGGGKQAVQHVKLVPEGGGATIVAGSANQVENWAELRSFEHLQQLHAQRFRGAEIPLNRVQYNELLAKLQAFFADKGCRVRLAAAPSPSSTPASQPKRASVITSGTLVIVIVFVAAIAAALALTWVMTHR